MKITNLTQQMREIRVFDNVINHFVLSDTWPQQTTSSFPSTAKHVPELTASKYCIKEEPD